MRNAALHTDLDLIESGLRQVGFLYQADIIVLAGLRIREMQAQLDRAGVPQFEPDDSEPFEDEDTHS